MCTLHLHMLLTKCCTQVYSYIANDTINIWDEGGALTFGLWWVYMIVLTLWFFDWEFCTYFDCTFLGVYVWVAHWVWDYVYIRTILYIYIYEWNFQYVFKELKSFNFSHFLQVTSSDLAKQPHNYLYVRLWGLRML